MTASNSPTTINIRNRRLEQFLYAHGIDFISCNKDDEDMTIWTYENTEEVKRIMKEFTLANERRNARKGA